MPGIKDWFKKASSDLKLAKKALGDDEALDPAVYLTHQCAEKSLKAYFVFMQASVPKTHDLAVLLERCVQEESLFLELQKGCKILGCYGFSSRYPNDSFCVNQDDLAEALEMAEQIFSLVKKRALSK